MLVIMLFLKHRRSSLFIRIVSMQLDVVTKLKVTPVVMVCSYIQIEDGAVVVAVNWTI
jgi:hypothetical protein